MSTHIGKSVQEMLRLLLKGRLFFLLAEGRDDPTFLNGIMFWWEEEKKIHGLMGSI